MKKRTILVVGRIGELADGTKKGNMARMLLEECPKAGIDMIHVDDAKSIPAKLPPGTVVVYLSGKDKFLPVLVECCERGLTLLVVSSQIKKDDIPLNGLPIAVIHVPNLALLIQALLEAFKVFGPLCKFIGARSVLSEGHQHTKTSPPITLQTIADSLGVDHTLLGKVRDSAVAEAILDIPSGNVGGYGKHFIKCSLAGQTIWIQFETIGRLMYFEGLKAYLGEIERRGAALETGVHDGSKFVFPPTPEIKKLMDENTKLRKQLENSQPAGDPMETHR